MTDNTALTGRVRQATEKTLGDPVNNPSHYTQGNIECIDAIRAALGDEDFVSFCKGNAIKYLWRSAHKGKPVEDMEKAAWYLRRATEVMRGER